MNDIKRRLLETKIQARNTIDSAMDELSDGEGILVFVATTEGQLIKTSLTTYLWNHDKTAAAIKSLGEMIDNDRAQLLSATVDDLPEAEL